MWCDPPGKDRATQIFRSNMRIDPRTPSEEIGASTAPSFGATTNLLETLWKSARELGPGWVGYRLANALELRTGSLERKLPLRPWKERPLACWLRAGVPAEATAYAGWRNEHAGKFFADASQLAPFVSPAAVATAEAILRGQFPFFDQIKAAGFPPSWEGGPPVHFSRIDEFAGGDIKLVWELNRFSSAFYLGRAFARCGEDRYAEAFWQLVQDWAENNPPNRGANWKCGQEASFRVMALCFGLYLTVNSAATTPERIALLVNILAHHGERIARHIAYARSQKNNHSISEATGLLTLGILFPELSAAAQWQARALEVLAADVAEQFYEDGSYVQHSLTYQRLAMHDLQWAMALAKRNGVSLPATVEGALRRASEFLLALVDPVTGRVPNYGANDGALVLPLTSCEYGDFRPVLQSSYYVTHGQRLLEPGPWDEEGVTLFGPGVLEAPQGTSTRRATAAEDGGYFLLRGGESWALTRCARFRHRPGHADQLHLDLWWKGVNVLLDPGTYSYNAPPPFDSALKNTRFHNTVTVEHRDQMVSASRFLWVDWAHGTVRRFCRGTDLDLLEMEHFGYRRFGITHRRAVVRAGDEAWVVVDDVLGRGKHPARLHWLGADFPFDFSSQDKRLTIDSSVGKVTLHVFAPKDAIAGLVRMGTRFPGDGRAEDGARGWQSPCYSRLEPALSFAVEADERLPVRFLTVISLGTPARPHFSGNVLELTQGERTLRLQLQDCGQKCIVENAELRGQHILARGSTKPPRSFLLIHQAFAGTDDPGGTRHFELGRRVARSGHRFTVIASDINYTSGQRVTPRAALFTPQEHEGIRIVRAYTLSRLHKSFVWRVVTFFSFMATSFAAALRSGPVDLVIGTTPPIFQAATAWAVAALRRKPYLLEVRDLWPQFAVDMGVLKNRVLIAMSRWLEGFLYRHSSHILVNSPAYRDYIAAKGIPREKISLVANGVDASLFDPESSGEGFRSAIDARDRFVITYAGAMGLANDLGTVLEAASLLRGREDILFALVGDGKERPALQAEMKRLQLGNVVFAGPFPKSGMAQVLAGSDACLAILKNIAMFATTYPNKVFDYMAAGRPTLLAIDGVIRDVVDAAGAGIAVPPGDPEALAQAAVRLADDRPSSRQMGRRGRVYVAQHFNRDQQAREFEELIVRLAEAGR
jgi:glycosyltransferase involved in cell wall biosynthesis